MKKFKYKGEDFLIQAYQKNEMANICVPNGGCFRLDFKQKNHESFFKDTKEEERIQNEKIKSIIDVDEIKGIIDNLFE